MGAENGLDEFFEGWFNTLEKGLEKLDVNECSCLFSECAKTCSEFVVSGLYRPLFEECEGDLDKFFNNTHKIDNVDSRILEQGKKYELIFKKCECPVHTDAKISSPRLCVCSKESMICVFKALVPERKFELEQISTILDGSDVCKHVITFN